MIINKTRILRLQYIQTWLWKPDENVQRNGNNSISEVKLYDIDEVDKRAREVFHVSLMTDIKRD